jgi:hypothetical protein
MYRATAIVYHPSAALVGGGCGDEFNLNEDKQ